jgi:predicted RNase H-related nuclease YkuK (DUF458 family)
MFSQDQVHEIVELLETLDSSTKIYFGCDSVRLRKKGKWIASYATVMIVHINGKNGCRLFSNLSVEPDYDVKINRPRMRMMNEVRKVCELYAQMIPYIENFAEIVEGPDGELLIKEFEIEVHLDINTDPLHGSSCAAKEAAGYVLAMTGLSEDRVKLKPESFAASFGADAVANGRVESSIGQS